MLYIKGKPLLAYIIDIVKSAGINEIVLIIGHGGENIRNYINTYYKKLNVKFVVQEKRQGTAHAIQQAEQYVTDDFLVLNGDVLFEPQLLNEMLHSHKPGCITMAAAHRNDPENYGALEIKDGRIVRIHEKSKNPPSNIINAGSYIFPKEIFEAIKQTKLSARGEYEITDSIQILFDKDICSNYVVSKHRFELSNPKDYQNASLWIDKYLK